MKQRWFWFALALASGSVPLIMSLIVTKNPELLYAIVPIVTTAIFIFATKDISSYLALNGTIASAIHIIMAISIGITGNPGSLYATMLSTIFAVCICTTSQTTPSSK